MPRIKKSANTPIDHPRINDELIRELSASPAGERTAAIRWFAAESEEIRLRILEKQTELLREKRPAEAPITPEILYSLLVVASKSVRKDEESLAQKRALSVAEADSIANRRADGFKKERRLRGADKYQKIKVQFFGLITQLLTEKKFTWAEITEYLSRYHGFEADRTYIYRAYNKIKKGSTELPPR